MSKYLAKKQLPEYVPAVQAALDDARNYIEIIARHLEAFKARPDADSATALRLGFVQLNESVSKDMMAVVNEIQGIANSQSAPVSQRLARMAEVSGLQLKSGRTAASGSVSDRA